jgi:hypothetical protein
MVTLSDPRLGTEVETKSRAHPSRASEATADRIARFPRREHRYPCTA